MKSASLILYLILLSSAGRLSAELLAGTAKVDITHREAGPVSDPLYAKALVLKNGETTAVLITIDAVAIGEIGAIKNDFLLNVREELKAELGIEPESVLINASHCHGRVRGDTEALSVKAVKQAWETLEPVKAGVGTGQEDRISENRRLRMKDGREIDMRRAYSLPPDEEVESVGPIDPEIGILRLDRMDGRPLAVLYNFACHPIMGAPGGGNTAGFPGFASDLLEEAMGEGAMAFFVQGCGGDINPIRYKTVSHPPDGEPLGHRLGMAVLRAWRDIETAADAKLVVRNEVVNIPRATDFEERIAAIDAEQDRLVRSLRPTDINFKTFTPLRMQHQSSPDFPSYYSHGYLHDHAHGRNHLEHHDATIERNVDAYVGNIHIMEELTRLNVNRRLLQKNLEKGQAAGNEPIEAEIGALRVGDFRMVTFPGELTVQIGLNLKEASPHPHSFVAGYTNGYLYYLPTKSQRSNSGYAQEDCDCLVAPEWQEIFETKALEILTGL